MSSDDTAHVSSEPEGTPVSDPESPPELTDEEYEIAARTALTIAQVTLSYVLRTRESATAFAAWAREGKHQQASIDDEQMFREMFAAHQMLTDMAVKSSLLGNTLAEAAKPLTNEQIMTFLLRSGLGMPTTEKTQQ